MTFREFMLDLNPFFAQYEQQIDDLIGNESTLGMLIESGGVEDVVSTLETAQTLPEFTKIELIRGFRHLVKRWEEVARSGSGEDWYEIRRDLRIRDKVLEMIESAEEKVAREGLQ